MPAACGNIVWRIRSFSMKLIWTQLAFSPTCTVAAVIQACGSSCRPSAAGSKLCASNRRSRQLRGIVGGAFQVCGRRSTKQKRESSQVTLPPSPPLYPPLGIRKKQFCSGVMFLCLLLDFCLNFPCFTGDLCLPRRDL